MNKLSKEKRNQLILVVVVTIVGLLGLWFGLINFQEKALKRVAERKVARADYLTKMEQAIRNVDRLENDTQEATRKLAMLEDDMAPGDAFAWMANKLREFRLPYKVEVPMMGQPAVEDMKLLPKFPYKQAVFSIGGTGCFHDVGKFIADLENHFPYFRVQNLDLSVPMALAEARPEAEKEKLAFHMEIVTLVKPGAS